MKKHFLSFLFLFIAFLLLHSRVFADDKFSTAATTTYTVNPTGNTHVVMNITITNTTPNYYVTSYSLTLGLRHMTNITVHDDKGQIVPVLTTTPNGQEVMIQFNSIVSGLNSNIPLTISYDTSDITTQNGAVWEINVPGLQNQNDFTSFNVQVIVPASFGTPSYIKPQQPTNSLYFTKDELGKSGISIGYGSSQIYNFRLLYHLQNTNLFPISTQIALPPTTNYQQIRLDSLSPKPSQVSIDADGNWLATYILSPSQTTTITAKGAAFVSLYPSVENLTKEQVSEYLRPLSFWQVNDSSIQKLAKQLQTPEKIYDYVVSHLSYDFGRVGINQERLGAVGILQNPTQAVCLEFTDLFVTLARAAGIPAREVDGYGYTQNALERPISKVADILHAWPEYYDLTKKEWIMVDPTWGNTTGGVDYFHQLDTDHIAFALKGISSDYPIPAGGYKLAGHQDDRDISISFEQNETLPNPQVASTIFLHDTYVSAFPISGQITFTNSGTTLFPSQSALITSSTLNPSSQTLRIPYLPPFGHMTVPFAFHKTPFLTNQNSIITIAMFGKTYEKRITIMPFTPEQLIIGGGIIFGIFSIFILIITAKARSVSVS